MTASTQTNHAADSTSLQLRRQVIDQYTHSLKENLLLYTGTEYRGAYSNTIGHPFFASEQMQPATIVFNNITYYNIPLQYDLVQDEVVIHDYEKNFKIKLDKKSIQSFHINGHHFVQVNEGSTAPGKENFSFYEQLYKNGLTVLVKRRKQLALSIKEDERSRFVEYNIFYIEKDGKYYSANNQASLLRVMKDHKDELRKFLNQEKLNYKKNPELFIVRAAEYYDRLKK